MTIDEHFLYMVLLESIIFFVGIAIMYMGQRKQTKLIESIVYNPDYAAAVATNMLFGFMDRVSNDKESQEKFFGFLQTCAVSGAAGVRHWMQGEGAAGNVLNVTKGGKVKPGPGLADIANQLLGSAVDGFLRGGGKKVAEAAEKVPEGW